MAVDTAISSPGGRFEFSRVPAGSYFLYGRVPQHLFAPPPEGMESDSTSRKSWLGIVRVPARDTVRAVLWSPRTQAVNLDKILQFDRATRARELDRVLQSGPGGPLRHDESPSGRLAGWIDLNGDEQLDALVLLRPRNGWAKGGTLLVFAQRQDSLVLVSRTTGVQEPISASPSMENGWHDLFVKRPSRSRYPAYAPKIVRLRFDSSAYPPNLSAAEVVDWREVALTASLPIIQWWRP